MQLDQSNKAAAEPSEVVSRYLEAIYYMWSEKESLRSARLADWLGVSRPTVTVGLRRMARDGLVRMNGRKEIELTAKGMRTAESIVRRHRIMERWLTDGLGLDWVTADAEAARLEHAVSDVVEQRLYEVLGRPTTCPHGNPIPGRASRVSPRWRSERRLCFWPICTSATSRRGARSGSSKPTMSARRCGCEWPTAT